MISVDPFNTGPADLVIVCPITSRLKPVRNRVPVAPPEGGLKLPSHILTEAVRSVSTERLSKRLGTVSAATTEKVEFWLKVLLGLN